MSPPSCILIYNSALLSQPTFLECLNSHLTIPHNPIKVCLLPPQTAAKVTCYSYILPLSWVPVQRKAISSNQTSCISKECLVSSSFPSWHHSSEEALLLMPLSTLKKGPASEMERTTISSSRLAQSGSVSRSKRLQQ